IATVVAADRSTIAVEATSYLRGDLLQRAIYPSVAYDGRPGAPPTIDPVAPPGGDAGRVAAEVDHPDQGRFVSTVVASRAAAVVLSASSHPGWRAYVDGVPVEPFMVAPSFVAVNVPAGTHAVEFRFVPYRHYVWLWLFGVATLIVTAGPRRVSEWVARQ